MQTTVGQILINKALPEHLRDYSRVLDKNGMRDLSEALVKENNPELYRKVMHSLYTIGHKSAHTTGSSLSLKDLRPSGKSKALMDVLRAQVSAIMDDGTLSPDTKSALVNKLVNVEATKIEKIMYKDALAEGNSFAEQVLSGSRGKVGDMRSLILGDMLVTDHKDRTIDMPILKGYASGVDPAEYWAGSYGARQGVISTKQATQDAGALGKQLIQAAHREVVTEDDCGTVRGIPVEANDPDNDGVVLAHSIGDLTAGTVLTPRNMKALKGQEAVVRSPLTCEAKQGVCSKCVGVRERGDFPEIGDNVGVAAAQSLAERVSQTSLSKKHSGGRAELGVEKAELQGFDLINQLAQAPKSFRGAAAIASVDGTVQSVEKAPQGGQFVTVNNERHFIPSGYESFVKPGDRVEEGDIMSEGIPNPLEIVRHRGVGDGRLQFVNTFKKAFTDSGMSASRRNIEILARGLVNHVQVNDLDGPNDSLPGDVVEYTSIERDYRPRYGSRTSGPGSARGGYLERPVMQYSIGTRVTKSVAENLKKRGIKEVTYHADPPSFEPKMVRAMENLTVSPDWQVRMGGSFLQKGLLEAVHRGRPSATESVSFVPGLARSTDFGKRLKEEGVY